MQTENKKEQYLEPVNIDKFYPLHVNHGGHPDNGRIQIGSAKDYIAEMYSDEPYEGEDYITDAESHALADELVKRYNTQPKLAKALQDMIKLAERYSMVYGLNEAESQMYFKATNTLKEAGLKQD